MRIVKNPIRLTAVFLSIFSFIVISLILTGWFDPQPNGELVWERSLFPVIASARSERVVLVDEGAFEKRPFSVRLTAVFDEGNPDSRYGLLLDDLSVTISPTGYAAIEQSGAAIVPYAPFPHVDRDGVNEIWVDVDGDTVVVRLNRELFWQGKAQVWGDIGVVVENFGDGMGGEETAVVDFRKLSLWRD